MRKSILSIAIAAATMAVASAFLSTTPAGGETKTPVSVILEEANWPASGVQFTPGNCAAPGPWRLTAGRDCPGSLVAWFRVPR
jgi:hypothetical protein